MGDFLAVCPSVGPSVHLCEKVTFRLSNGNLNLPSYLWYSSDSSDSSDINDSSDSSDRCDQTTLYTKKLKPT